uniref:Uncharacterized protein n=1 Tax=Cucumis melo TaxID=3656 RepID=A0A9I9ELK3_CUCME
MFATFASIYTAGRGIVDCNMHREEAVVDSSMEISPLLKEYYYIEKFDALGSTLASYLHKPRVYVGCMKSGEVFSEPSIEDIRCIVFVERIVSAMALQTLLSLLLPKHTCWKTKYIAGSTSSLQTQSKKKQNEIVEEFRCGKVLPEFIRAAKLYLRQFIDV